MRVDAFSIDPGLTQVQMDQIINNLYVNMHYFSRIASCSGRMFGVYTHIDTCNIEINRCAQEAMIRNLISSQKMIEDRIGTVITDRYVTEEILWDGAEMIQLKYMGLDTINVAASISDIDAYGPFAISPYIEEDVTFSEIDGRCVATVDAALVSNPSKVQFWDENGNLYKAREANGYPKRVGNTWEIQIDGMKLPCDEADTLNVQHAEYMILEVTSSENAYPVYPESNQKIPMAKEPQSLGGGQVRYWFHPWDLVDEAFRGDRIDLERGQVYKLISDIPFKAFEEIEALPSVIVMDIDHEGWTTFATGEGEIKIEIISKDISSIYIEYGEACRNFFRNLPRPIKLLISYKVSPRKHYDLDIHHISQAIAYLAAAELPLRTCDCTISEGFIEVAQQKVSEVRLNPITGEVIQIPRNPTENQYGKIIFWNTIKNLSKVGGLVKI